MGGGAQVVFQDVEILKQRDPQCVRFRKRSSDGLLKVDSEIVKDRCGYGTGMTPNAKRFKK